MGLHRQLKLEGRWAGAERIFGLSESSGVLACEQAAGEGPYFHGLFFPGGSLLCLSLLRLKDFTDLLECSLSFISMDDPQPLRQAYWTCAVSSVGRTWSSAGCHPACSRALGPAPFLS